jgi:hypothetical protein
VTALEDRSVPAVVSGVAFYDLNNNGVKDSLDAGTYTIEFTAPEGYLMITTAKSTSSTSVSTPGSSSVAVGAYEPASISGTVWVDADNDGVRDGGEDALANVLVIATDDSGQIVLADTTDDAGGYALSNLRPGTYQITFTASGGYRLNGAANTITVSGALASGDIVVIDRPAYGDEQTGGIGGSVWEDIDANGVKDEGESFLSGVLVELLDSDGDPVLDEFSDPMQVTTAGDGLYSFGDLEAGLYVVRFTAPNGYVMVSSHDQVTTRTIITPGTETSADEGAYQPENFVSGSVWLDQADWDGEWGGGESGLAGVVVALTDLAGGTVLDLESNPVVPVTTDAYGAFAFPEVAPGNYLVTMTAPSGYAMEGSGIPMWKGRFEVGGDHSLQVGAYEQEATQNQPAVPEPAPAPRAYDSIFKIVSTNTWLTTPPALRPTVGGLVNKWDQALLPTDYQHREVIKITFPDLTKIAPPGTKFLTSDAQVFLTVSRGTILTDPQIQRIRESIQEKLKEEYKAILTKQSLFEKIGGPKNPAPNYDDLMQLVQAIPRGLFAASVTGVQARLDGGIANWVFHTGLGIDPGKLTAKGNVDFKLNPNWGDIKVISGVKISYGADRMIFTPSVEFDGNGFS